MTELAFTVTLPPWVSAAVDFDRVYETNEDKMDLAIGLASRNVTEGTGGPFGAAIFDIETGRLVAPGVNVVVPASNPTAHAEIVAMGVAGALLGSYDIGEAGPTILATSVEPCAMCLGATPWSGVSALLVGARDEDARRIGFDEGSKPVDWVASLNDRGISVTVDVRREAAVGALTAYTMAGGEIYNSESGDGDA